MLNIATSKSQSGGGMHSEYCPLCLLSYEPLPEIEEDEAYDDDDEEDEREENQLKKLSNVDLKWLRNGLAFDRDTHKILPVEGDDMYGQFPIKGRKGDLFTSEITIGNDGDAGWGPVFHEDCIKSVGAQLNRPVTYEDGIEIFKLVENRSGPFHGQHFEWEEAVEEEGPAYFYSPMDPKGKDARDRINKPIAAWVSTQKRIASPTGKKGLQREEAAKELARARAELKQALDKVDELKREVAVREVALAAISSPQASPPKGKQTNRRAPKKQPKQAAASQPKLNCSSHKTKDACPPNVCVWGKSNRCSKKRTGK